MTASPPDSRSRTALTRPKRTRSQIAGWLLIYLGFAVSIFWSVIAIRDGAHVVVATLGTKGLYLGGLITIMLQLGGTILILRARAETSRRLHATNGRLCPRCHYDLSGLDSSASCPECGDSYSPAALAAVWRRL